MNRTNPAVQNGQRKLVESDKTSHIYQTSFIATTQTENTMSDTLKEALLAAAAAAVLAAAQILAKRFTSN